MRLRIFAAAWFAIASAGLAVVWLLSPEAHIDFVGFYCAGQAVAHGANPYTELPLHACEQAITRGGVFASNVTLPAPLPPFALVPFAALSLLPFGAAIGLFVIVSFVATAAGCMLLARMTAVPLALVAALAAPSVWDNWVKGQPVTLSFLGIVLCGYLLEKGRDRWAVAAALASLVHPQIGLAVCASLFVWRPRTRAPLLVCAAVAAAASIAAVSLPVSLAYVRDVLPLQARSEAYWITQISAVNPLVLFGVPVGAALAITALQQAAVTAGGVVIAGLFARRRQAVAAIVWFPALCAVLGGTYEHGNVLLVALPAALLIARTSGSGAAYAAACAAVMAWPFLADPVAPWLVAVALFTVAALTGAPARVAVAAPLGVVAAAAFYAHFNHGLQSLPEGIPVIGTVYAEASWSQLIDAINPDASTQWLAFAYKLPIWFGLAASIGYAVRLSAALRCAVPHATVRSAPSRR